MDDERRAVEANRTTWEEHARLHERSQLPRLLEGFQDPAFTTLDATLTGALETLDVHGKRVLQLCCNNGRELLSVLRMGAAKGVGVDLAAGNLAQGRRMAAVAGRQHDVRFVQADVMRLGSGSGAAASAGAGSTAGASAGEDTAAANASGASDATAQLELGTFDLVFLTVGALGWLPRLEPVFAAARAHLNPGGQLLLYEMHPILDMFEAAEGPVPKHDYFRTEPYVEAGGPDYFQPAQRIEATAYWFHHTLAEIIGAVLAAGLRLERFEEYGHDISNVFRAFQELPARPPLSYLLVARRSAPVPDPGT